MKQKNSKNPYKPARRNFPSAVWLFILAFSFSLEAFAQNNDLLTEKRVESFVMNYGKLLSRPQDQPYGLVMAPLLASNFEAEITYDYVGKDGKPHQRVRRWDRIGYLDYMDEFIDDADEFRFEPSRITSQISADGKSATLTFYARQTRTEEIMGPYNYEFKDTVTALACGASMVITKPEDRMQWGAWRCRAREKSARRLPKASRNEGINP